MYLATQRNKQEPVRILIDPFGENLGLRPPSLEADIVLVSNEESNNIKTARGEPVVVSGPGEYDIRDVYIEGISSTAPKGKNTIYTIETEKIKLCHLGNIGQPELTGEQLERLGDIHILFIPIGDMDGIGAKEAVKITNQLEPSIVIPMRYLVPKLALKLAGLTEFLKIMGAHNTTPEPKLAIKAKDIVSEETKVMVLTP